ncbi:SAF domain-containing protein [Paenibacillus timonensis]|uniref:SAF domain-containing protein n=1 Tax=Paenibacillus timonensis TaxID=225915 RepID=A0ABW3S7V3_9BACL|nr:SAF domain-containing protein [Paenibacillus timonensis]MCH1638787.1 SAF domain-containing protein [Paenibacillus timonensis]
MSLLYRYRKPIVIIAIGFSFVLLLVSTIFVLQHQAQQKRLQQQMRAHYEQQIEQLKTNEQQGKTRILVAARPIPAGKTLGNGDIQAVEVVHALVPSDSFKDPQMVVGKIAKIDLQSNTPLIASMLYEEGPIPRDLRMQEFNVIQLPTHLQKDQVVDVRINFPTGEDYIVLSKKKVRDLSGMIVRLEINEPEILMASSAIIDAYLQGAKLYALPYIEPGLQEAAIANYPANPKVLDLMDRDPNVLEKAKTELARQLRSRLDINLKAMSDADKLRVVSGSVTVQQQLQNDRIVTQQGNAMEQSAQQQAAGVEQTEQDGLPPSDDKPASTPEPTATEPASHPQQGTSQPLPEPSASDEQPTNTDKLDDIFNQPPVS